MRPIVVTLILAAGLFGTVAKSQSPGQRGVLVLAHGGQAVWNANVNAIVAEVDRTLPADMALGMADRSAIAAAAERLRARGVAQIVAVPLFVSSHSSVLTSTEYLLGLRQDKPAQVEIFARMRHGTGAVATQAAHQEHAAEAAPTLPIQIDIPVRMTSALDSHPLVCDIVTDRARAMSVNPEREAVVLVAHGPNEDQDNERWLKSLDEIGRAVSRAVPFAHVGRLTVRDDAPAPVKAAATADLRSLVSSQTSQGRRVLIVPVLLSYGGIEAGIRERLAGLSYSMSEKALAPDPRLVDWVLAQALR